MTRVYVRLPSLAGDWTAGVQVYDYGAGWVRVRLHQDIVQPPEAVDGMVTVHLRDVVEVEEVRRDGTR